MFTSKLPTDTDLSAMFDIDMERDEIDFDSAVETFEKIKCPKCKGGGRFIGWSGAPLGKCFKCDGTGIVDGDAKAANSHDIDVAKISAAFAAARANDVKRPKLRLGEFLFSRAPDDGKTPGAIYVKRGETYLGMVKKGKFHPSRDCWDKDRAAIIAIAADPAAAAVAYGRRMGRCSVCGITLTNHTSIDRGIGPICYEKFFGG